jgi:hypothetical protein
MSFGISINLPDTSIIKAFWPREFLMDNEAARVGAPEVCLVYFEEAAHPQTTKFAAK